MRVIRILAVFAATTLPLTACSDTTEPDHRAPSTQTPSTQAPSTQSPSGQTSSGTAVATPAVPEIEPPKVSGLGTTAHTAGSGGGMLDLTPSSVVYVPRTKSKTPVNGTYAVVAYKARSTTAVAATETTPTANGGWRWTARDGRTVTTLTGNATSVTPNGFNGSGPVKPGSDQWRSRTFDLPKSQHGGTLAYTDGKGRVHRWAIPAKDSGPETAKLKKALEE
ncbi:hypothetical protein A6A06_28550 [Streptomyces sp. CB02923]|uniref:hypothetical protein n=1 Tax=Streptomyces sp. CB02923 TaxID=1718985 RepID=UPI0009389A50|nr:hypothetical protein [Streptomyces sp. CB02923]OKH98162.1 hypothetical protein A6A06_28550 [Streptomyces sp. CB02923]